MKTYTDSIILATDSNLDAIGYLELNADVKKVLLGPDFDIYAPENKEAVDSAARRHFSKYGKKEGRSQFDYPGIKNAREQKKKILEKIIAPKIKHVIDPDFGYNFLDASIREKFRVFDTTNISSNAYDYEGHESDPSKLILDCDCGFRKRTYANVICFDIVDYISTDVIGVGEQLPFRDNSFDVVMSYAVLEHVTDPQRCMNEMHRVLKPGGLLYFQACFMQPLHGYPSHYFNITPEGALLLVKNADFTVCSQEVTPNFLPIYSLRWMIRKWAEGLSAEDSDGFLSQTLGYFLEKNGPEAYEDDPFVKNLSKEAERIICAGTTVVAQKKEKSPKRKRKFSIRRVTP